MKIKKNNRVSELLHKRNIVAVITSEEDMRQAMLVPQTFQIVEWRYDCSPSEEIEFGLRELNKPVIITVRDLNEGGADKALTVENRIGIFRRCMQMGCVAFVDIELSTVVALKNVTREAHEMGIGVILSYHNLYGVPSLKEVQQLHSSFNQFHGDILKLAVTPQSMQQLIIFEQFVLNLRHRFNTVVAAMAMKKYGKLSRLIDGFDQSPLIYSCVKDAIVTGQWRAGELGELLEKL